MPRSSRRRDADSIARPAMFHPLMVVAFICLLLFPAAFSWGEMTYHVSVDGSDDHPGTDRQPFRSVSKAQRAVRTLLRDTSDTPVTVIIHPGTYWLEEPLTYSYGSLMDRKAFTVSVPSERHVKEAGYFGLVSGEKTL